MILEDHSKMSPVKRGRQGAYETDDKDDNYYQKRVLNNEAVKKSRMKSKQRTQETFTRVNKLKAENQTLEEKVKTLTKDLQFLKELFVEYASNSQSPKFQGIDLENFVDLLEDEKV